VETFAGAKAAETWQCVRWGQKKGGEDGGDVADLAPNTNRGEYKKGGKKVRPEREGGGRTDRRD